MKKVSLLLLFLIAHMGYAKLWTPSIISDHMVLQQQSTITIWGWSTVTNETLTIVGSWDNQELKTKVHQGVWQIQMPTPVAGGPYTLSIKGHEELVFSNVMLGEVWIASGQSNMQWTPNMGLDNVEEEIKNANYPEIRFFNVPQRKSASLQDDTPGQWEVCSPETMQNFSSVGYFFGRKLHKDLNVPVGIISSNWGGTPVEVWIPGPLIQNDQELKQAADKLSEFEWWPEQPGSTYNAMIHPLTRFEIAGAIWYQGESNRVNAKSYYRSFPVLIEAWRKAWQKEIPFYFAQIAPYTYNKDVPDVQAAVVRDAQLHTMQTVSNTGMAVTNDIGNLQDIHPTNKQEVGRRLALWALAKTYGASVVYSGPIFRELEIVKNKAILHFDHVVEGLEMQGKTLNEFYMAGPDKVFHKAKAKIKGNTVVVTASQVKNPAAVRFAFYDKALPNLFNSEGLPASAFRTDDWELKLD